MYKIVAFGAHHPLFAFHTPVPVLHLSEYMQDNNTCHHFHGLPGFLQISKAFVSFQVMYCKFSRLYVLWYKKKMLCGISSIFSVQEIRDLLNFFCTSQSTTILKISKHPKSYNLHTYEMHFVSFSDTYCKFLDSKCSSRSTRCSAESEIFLLYKEFETC